MYIKLIVAVVMVLGLTVVTASFAAPPAKVKNSRGQTVGTVRKTGNNQYTVKNNQGRTTSVIKTTPGGKTKVYKR